LVIVPTFPLLTRWLNAGGELSRPNRPDQRPVRRLMCFQRASKCSSRTPKILRLCMVSPVLMASRPKSPAALTANPHSARCQPVPNFPRLRALALFERRPPEHVVSSSMPASENLHKTRLMRRSKLCSISGWCGWGTQARLNRSKIRIFVLASTSHAAGASYASDHRRAIPAHP
jgi:hypothetical protein